jgi:class 3 adenylate cyclase
MANLRLSWVANKAIKRRKMYRGSVSPALEAAFGEPSTRIVSHSVNQFGLDERPMFSDLVGSTALSARMDPEDLREVISAYQKCVAETIQRFGGFVASTWATVF